MKASRSVKKCLQKFCSKFMEHTDEEVECSYEEFYEDVHTEFLKFGEIINFKVCRNGSYHLRGNVYVHYKSLDSALAAYQSVNGRYFAGKQVTCEFVGVTRWKVAICGEFMRSRLKTCSRGTACNFIHCFRNPGGDYEWADWDKPPPRSWMEKMAALFGYSYESVHDRQTEEGTVGPHRNSSKRLPRDQERYDRLRSHSSEIDSSNRRSREHYEEDNPPRIKYKQRHISGDSRDHRRDEFEAQTRHYVGREKRAYHDESRDSDVDENSGSWRKRSRRSQGKILASDNCPDTCSLEGRHLGISTDSPKRGEEKSTRQEFSQKSSRKQEASSGIMDTVGSHKTRSVSDDSTSGWRRTNGSDSTSDLSDGITQSNHSHRRKSSRHPSEVSRSSNNHIDDYPRNKSETMKLKMRKTSSHKRELHSSKTSETECRDEHLKLYDRHGDRKSKLYHERSKSYDSDISGSHDCRESLEETDIRDRWVPDKVDAVKRDKHIRKSDRSYKKRENKDPGSHDSSSECSDACFQDSRSRGSSKSKEGRSRGSRASSDEKCKTSSSHSNRNHQEYGEDGRSHKRKSHRSDGKQESNESESHGWSFESSDACFKESRSRGSSKSKEGRTRAGHSPRNRKHKTSSTQIDSERKHKESGEGGSSHKRKKISSVGEE